MSVDISDELTIGTHTIDLSVSLMDFPTVPTITETITVYVLCPAFDVVLVSAMPLTTLTYDVKSMQAS